MDIADIITETNYWAGKSGGELVKAEHVVQAIEQKHYRLSLTEDRMQELIDGGTIHIATDGKRVGEINGLAVYSVGDLPLASPARSRLVCLWAGASSLTSNAIPR